MIWVGSWSGRSSRQMAISTGIVLGLLALAINSKSVIFFTNLGGSEKAVV